MTSVNALPALVQLRVEMLAQQRALAQAHIKQIEHELSPRLLPARDAQRLLYIPGIGKITAFTILLEDLRSSLRSTHRNDAFTSRPSRLPLGGNSLMALGSQ